MAPPIVGKVIAYLLAFLFITLVCAGIVLLIRSMTCAKDQPVNLYEHFADSDSYLKNLKKRIPKVKKASETIQNDLDILSESADDTCNIMNNVEETYISSKAIPSDDSEFDLPKEAQQKKMDRRQARAKKNFQLEKDAFVKTNGAKLLECFTDDSSADDIADAEEELNDAIGELTQVLDGAEMQMAIEKAQKTWFSLLFNAPYLKKAIDATTPKTSENFENQKGLELFIKADELVGKANTLHAAIVEFVKKVKEQKTVAGALNKKSADLQNGKVDQSDIDTATSHTTSNSDSKSS